MTGHRVYLVPGFFGFANLGRIYYFAHVHEALAGRLAAAGLDAEIHVVRPPPTASIPRRAAELVETIAATTRGRGELLHLVGHSSGGLDVRLVVSPGVTLPTRLPARQVERLAARVRTVVTVATPHHGTPLAGFFASLRGQRLLELLSVATIRTLHAGGLPLAALLELAGVLARIDVGRVRSAIVDALSEQLLADFSRGPRRAIDRLLRQVAYDQALLVQLTPEGMQVFDAAVRPRAGVRYGSVAAWAPRTGLRSTVAAGLDPAAQASHAAFGALQRLAAAAPRGGWPRLAAQHERALRRAYGRLPGPGESDGVVPTRSQPYGTLVHAARGDHLDVIGHFRGGAVGSPHVDWLASGSGFDAARFARLWTDVACFLARGVAD